MKKESQRSVALITGAAVRLGRATALSLAHRGMDVVIHCNRSVRAAEALAAEVELLGCRAAIVQADLSRLDTLEELFDNATRALGPISVLVNSASIYSRSSVLDFSSASLEQNIRINAMAPLVLSRLFAAQQIEKGCIVNFLDSRIGEYDAMHAAYHLSKRELHAITRMLAMELAPRIRVNAVAPGLVLPPEDAPANYSAMRQKELPLACRGSVDDVTRAVRFLVESPFVTGQTIFVDGGRHLSGNFYG